MVRRRNSASWNYPAAICASPACGLQVYYGLMLFALCTSCLEQVNTKTVTVMHFFHGRHFAVGPLGCCNRKQRVNRHGEDYSRKIAEYHHYWTSLRTSNVSSEGFNNKIWWLIRQGYGSRAIFYLRLKIFQLLSLHPQKVLYVMAQTGEKARRIRYN